MSCGKPGARPLLEWAGSRRVCDYFLVVFRAAEVVFLAAAFGAAFLAVVALAAAAFGAALVAVARAVLAAGFAAVARARVVVVARVAAVRVVLRVDGAADRVLVVVPRLDAGRAAAAFGSFFAPLTTSLNVVPARKAGTVVFLTLTVSPVRGLRAVRAALARFSNTPKPVMLTFSPLLTVRTITSTRPSTAAPAAFLSPSLSESASMSWALFTLQSSVDHTSFSAKPADFLGHRMPNSAIFPRDSPKFPAKGV